MKPKDDNNTVWDVVVIGGGAAGMMAAGRAAELGSRVLLLEKNTTLGKKLLITGGGRCNVTNGELDTKVLLAKFKDSDKYLFSPFSQFSVKDTLRFFNERGMPTKEEAEKRVFPVSNTARSVWEVLVAYLKETGVEVRSNSTVVGFNTEEGHISSVRLRGGETIHSKSFILATGGTSHPETGSTGDGYKWLRTIGHTVSDETAALVPVALKAPVVRAAGVSLSQAKITLYQNDTKQAQLVGKVLFTHVGLSGPGILNLSRDIGDLLHYGDVIIELDLLPNMGYEKVNEALQASLKEHSNKKIKNALSMLPPALLPVILATAEVNEDTFCNSITRESRLRLIKTLKHLRFEASHLLSTDKAITTAGGVDLREVDFKTMRSLKYPNLYIVGDMLNINRPSGGYSLQLCWTTGFVAGSAAVSS